MLLLIITTCSKFYGGKIRVCWNRLIERSRSSLAMARWRRWVYFRKRELGVFPSPWITHLYTRRSLLFGPLGLWYAIMGTGWDVRSWLANEHWLFWLSSVGSNSWSQSWIFLLTLSLSNALQYSCLENPSILAWRIPWTEEPGRPQSTAPQKDSFNFAIYIFFP